MSEITIENYTTVQTVEVVTTGVIVENVVSANTVVETTPAVTEVTVLDGTQNTLEVVAQNIYEVITEEGTVIEVETTTGPTGHAPVLYSGTAPPSEAIGTVGDLYLVNAGGTIGDLYQKSAAGWGTSKGNLRGGIASVNGISGTNITIAANNITTGVLPIAQVPTGTSGTTVALGNHLHTGVYEPVITTGLTTQFWRGDKTWVVIDKTSLGLNNVANVDTTNATNITSGTLAFGRLPTGTTSSTLAIGNHNHDTAYVALAGAQSIGGNKTFTNQVNVDTGNLRILPAAADHAYIAFYARTASPGTTSGAVGFDQGGGNVIYLRNMITNGGVSLVANGTGVITLTGARVDTPSLAATALRVGTTATAGYVLTADASGNATWQQTANIITPGTTAQYYRGDLSWQTLNAAAVGLGNVVNSVAVDLTTNQTVGGIKSFTSEIVGPTSGNVLKVGDDARIADVNLANAIAIVGIQNSALGGIVFGTNPTNWRIELTSAQAATVTGNTQFVGTITANNGINVVAGVISGNASGITAIPAGNLTGNVDIARLPVGTGGSNVAAGNHNHSGVYEPVIATAATTTYYRGDKQWATLTPTAVGLGNVANVVQVDLTSGQTITGVKTFTNASNDFTGRGTGLTALDASQLTTGTVTQSRLKHNTQRFVFTLGSEARPTGSTYVEWIGPVTPSNATSNDTWTDTSQQVIEDPLVSMPIGIIQMFPVTAPPSGWLACNGAAVSRSTYSVLFTLIGTTYGTGDGSTTFNLPNMQGRVVAGLSISGNTKFDSMGETGGAETHTLTEAEMPSHFHMDPTTTGTAGTYELADLTNPPQGYDYGVQSAPTTSTGGGLPHNNLQPYITLQYIIKAV